MVTSGKKKKKKVILNTKHLNRDATPKKKKKIRKENKHSLFLFHLKEKSQHCMGQTAPIFTPFP